MTTVWDLWMVPSTSMSAWPQQYQPIDVSAKKTTDKFRENNTSGTCISSLANISPIRRKLWYSFERHHRHFEYTSDNTNSPNNVEGVSDTPVVRSSLITSSVPVISVTSVNTLDAQQSEPVSNFLAEKPTEFNAFIERNPENDVHRTVRNLLDLMSNVTPYSWQTESPLADHADNYLDREIHDHFMQYDLKKNHCMSCGFQTEVEQF